MKKLFVLLTILLILPLTSAVSLEETMQPRVEELNAGISQDQIDKASIVLPASVQIITTDTNENFVVQATKENKLQIIASVKKPDITIKGTEANFLFFSNESMTEEEILAGMKDLKLQGNTFKGRLALKVVKEMLEKRAKEQGKNLSMQIQNPDDEKMFSRAWRWMTTPVVSIVGWFI
jgi:hypothetical protein